METTLATLITVVPPTLMAALAWRNARSAKNQTNGQLHEPLSRIEAKIDDLAMWQESHIGRWHNPN